MKYVSEEKTTNNNKKSQSLWLTLYLLCLPVQAKMIKIKFFYNLNSLEIFYIVVLVKLLRQIFSPALRIKPRIYNFPD